MPPRASPSLYSQYSLNLGRGHMLFHRHRCHHQDVIPYLIVKTAVSSPLTSANPVPTHDDGSAMTKAGGCRHHRARNLYRRERSGDDCGRARIDSKVPTRTPIRRHLYRPALRAWLNHCLLHRIPVIVQVTTPTRPLPAPSMTHQSGELSSFVLPSSTY